MEGSWYVWKNYDPLEVEKKWSSPFSKARHTFTSSSQQQTTGKKFIDIYNPSMTLSSVENQCFQKQALELYDWKLNSPIQGLFLITRSGIFSCKKFYILTHHWECFKFAIDHFCWDFNIWMGYYWGDLGFASPHHSWLCFAKLNSNPTGFWVQFHLGGWSCSNWNQWQNWFAEFNMKIAIYY